MLVVRLQPRWSKGDLDERRLNVLYTAEATAAGGREGHARTSARARFVTSARSVLTARRALPGVARSSGSSVILAVVALGGAAYALLQSLVVPALPVLRRDLG
jgi:hypothetical protein